MFSNKIRSEYGIASYTVKISLWTPNFVYFACGPPEICHGPLESMWTQVENHCSNGMITGVLSSEVSFSISSCNTFD